MAPWPTQLIHHVVFHCRIVRIAPDVIYAVYTDTHNIGVELTIALDLDCLDNHFWVAIFICVVVIYYMVSESGSICPYMCTRYI